jgi:hypothetical protein
VVSGRGARRSRRHALHSTASRAPVVRDILQDFVSTAPQVENVFSRLKTGGTSQCDRYLLARSMSPDPSGPNAAFFLTL